MKRILLAVIAFTVMSSTLYADGGKVAKRVKAECCSKGRCNEDCSGMHGKTVYAAKRGLVVLKGTSCTCC